MVQARGDLARLSFARVLLLARMLMPCDWCSNAPMQSFKSRYHPLAPRAPGVPASRLHVVVPAPLAESGLTVLEPEGALVLLVGVYRADRAGCE